MDVDGDVEGSRSSLTAEPLLRPKSTGERSVGMVLFSTAVAVCGSFEFGACVSKSRRWKGILFIYGELRRNVLGFFQVGYSAPTQAAIREELGLSLSEVGTASIAPHLAHTIKYSLGSFPNNEFKLAKSNKSTCV